MPRKTKEQTEQENNENIEEAVKSATKKTQKKADSKTSTTTKKPSTKKASTSTKSTAKKDTAKKTSASTKSTTEKDTTKKSSTSTKSTVKKDTAKKTSASAAKSTTKKASTKKASALSKSTKKRSSNKKGSEKRIISNTMTLSKGFYTKRNASSISKALNVVEYYDLPYRYNQTVVKVLAQTPNNLFIYWDISDEDRKNYKKQYGERFFEETKPVLVVHNRTLGYSFEIDINDFANSWYLHVNDAKCDYSIELGRRPIVYSEKINTDYIYISTSNNIESPNDRVLFNKEQKMVYFRNVKTGGQTAKPINTLSFIRNMGRIYHLYDLYKEIYQEEDIENLLGTSNPSSGNPSSDTFSSKFK